MGARHPQSPLNLQLPGSVPSLLSPAHTISLYFAAVSVVLLPVWFLTGRLKGMNKGERRLVCGMLALGLNHLVVEAYFLFTPHFYRTPTPMLLSEIWKLYSLADARYLVRNPAIMGIEGVLVLVTGPAALISVYGIVSKKSWLHPLLLMYCTTEIVMTISLFTSSWFEEKSHSLNILYFWFCYVLCNALYGIVIPLVIGVMSLKKVNYIISLHNQSPKKDV